MGPVAPAEPAVAMVRVCVAVPTFPAGSGTDATISHVPSLRAVGVAFHVPLGCRSVVNVCPPIATVTVVPGAASEAPVIVGSASLVVAVAPPVIATTGGTVSTVSVWVALARFPAASETDITTRCGPSERKAVVTDQTPPAVTSPVSVWSARVTVTVVPAATAAVPEMVGVESLVRRFAPPVIVTAGATVSTVSSWLTVV